MGVFGPRELSEIERCLYYGGRDYINLGFLETKETVQKRGVSVRSGSTVFEAARAQLKTSG